MSIALGNRDEDSITSLAGRLARLDRQVSDDDKKELEKVTEDRPLKQIINELPDAVDPDKKVEKAREMFKTDERCLSLQEKSGRTFTPEQIEWLRMIKDPVATSLRIEMDDFELSSSISIFLRLSQTSINL